MSKLPAVQGQHLVKILCKNGFFIARQRGGHILLKDKKGHRITIPVHGAGRTLAKTTLRSIIRQSGMSREKFLKLL